MFFVFLREEKYDFYPLLIGHLYFSPFKWNNVILPLINGTFLLTLFNGTIQLYPLLMGHFISPFLIGHFLNFNPF